MKSRDIPPEYGFITRVIAGIFRFMQKVSLSQLFIQNRVDAFGKSDFLNLTADQRRVGAIKRAKRVDIYLLACVAFEIMAVIAVSNGLAHIGIIHWTIMILVILRLIDIVQVNINLSLFDVIRTGKELNYVASAVRLIINVLINYFEIILCFGIIYACNEKYLNPVSHWTDPFYYSIITQITVGFGQMAPHGILKLVTVLQFILGYFFTALIIGRFISLLPHGRTVAGDSQSDNTEK